MNAAALCSNCSQPLKPEASVRLWDGRKYCHPCVEQACPRLLTYALAHDVLEEAMPYNRNAVVRRTLLLIGIACAAFLSMVALVPHEEEMPSWVGFGLAALVISAILVAIYVPDQLWTAKRATSKVSASEGKLAVCRPRIKALRQLTFALSDCRWYVGRVRHDSLLTRSLAPNQRAIILVYTAPVPDYRNRLRAACGLSGRMREILVYFLTAPVPGFRIRIRTACGFSKEMREVWEGFLRLARVAEARKWGDAPFLHRLGDLFP